MPAPTHNDILIRLKTVMEAILGPDHLNVLGQFEFLQGTKVISTSPSIRIGFPLSNTQPIFRMKVNSGIQCIVDTAPIMHYQRQGVGLVRFHTYYAVYLDQYNPNLGLIDAVKAILQMPTLRLYGDPILSPTRIDPDKGVIPQRAILYIERIIVENSYV